MSTSVAARVEDIVRDAANALSSELPAASWSVVVDSEATALDGGRVVVASLGAEFRIGLMMSPSLGRSLIVGPPSSDTVEEALTPAFEAAASSLTRSQDLELTLSVLSESTEVEALASLGGSMFTARLLDGEEHVATFVLASSGDLAAQYETESPVFEQIPAGFAPAAHHPVSMLSDVAMGITVELGRAQLTVAEILALTIGSVIELDRIAGSPVDVLVNGTLIARGEVVVVDEEFGVRVSEVLGYQPTERNRR